MFGRRDEPHASVYMLADHLDAILAAGEDLATIRHGLNQWRRAKSASAIRDANSALHRSVERIAVLELLITTHLRQARVQAKQLIRADKRFASLVRLFLGGTAAIVDILNQYASAHTRPLDHAADLVAFLRTRRLIGAESPGLQELDYLQPDEGMVIAGVIELGELLDLVAAFLGSLDVAYDLYPVDKPLLSAPATATPPKTSGSPPGAQANAPAGGSPKSALDALKNKPGAP